MADSIGRCTPDNFSEGNSGSAEPKEIVEVTRHRNFAAISTFENASEEEDVIPAELVLEDPQYSSFKKSHINFKALSQQISHNSFILSHQPTQSALLSVNKIPEQDRIPETVRPSFRNQQTPALLPRSSTLGGPRGIRKRNSMLRGKDRKICLSLIRATPYFFQSIPLKSMGQVANLPDSRACNNQSFQPTKPKPCLSTSVKKSLGFEQYIDKEIQKMQSQRTNQGVSPSSLPQVSERTEGGTNRFFPSSLPKMPSSRQEVDELPHLNYCFEQSQEEGDRLLRRGEMELLEAKIYQPYFVSNNTIIEFQQMPSPRLADSGYFTSLLTGERPPSSDVFSIVDILENFIIYNKSKSSRLYFKVSHRELEKASTKSVQIKEETKEEVSQSSQAPRGKEDTLGYSMTENEEAMSEPASAPRDPKRGKTDYLSRLRFRKEEQKRKSIGTASPDLSSPANRIAASEEGARDEDVGFFEMELKKVDELMFHEGQQSSTVLLNIKNVTSLVRNQQRLSDKQYQEAIENNYSHEQMTPLNCIQANSSLIKARLLQLYAQLHQVKHSPDQVSCDQIFGKKSELEKFLSAHSQEIRESMQLISSVEQSGKAMWYFNSNQIQRMKIKQNLFKVAPFESLDLTKPILKVLWPFEHQIDKRKISVQIFFKQALPRALLADWKIYELILYNLVQNAVKYNQRVDGEILILLSCKAGETQFQSVLETEIIDTGIGISPDTQKSLFVPFSELKSKQGTIKQRLVTSPTQSVAIQQSSIGLGLSCSYELAKQLGGNVRLKQSKPGLTVFSFTMPVTVKMLQKRNSSINLIESHSLSSSGSSDTMQRPASNLKEIPLQKAMANHTSLLGKYLEQQQLSHLVVCSSPSVQCCAPAGRVLTKHNSLTCTESLCKDQGHCPSHDPLKPTQCSFLVNKAKKTQISFQKHQWERGNSFNVVNNSRAMSIRLSRVFEGSSDLNQSSEVQSLMWEQRSKSSSSSPKQPKRRVTHLTEKHHVECDPEVKRSSRLDLVQILNMNSKLQIRERIMDNKKGLGENSKQTLNLQLSPGQDDSSESNLATTINNDVIFQLALKQEKPKRTSFKSERKRPQAIKFTSPARKHTEEVVMKEKEDDLRSSFSLNKSKRRKQETSKDSSSLLRAAQEITLSGGRDDSPSYTIKDLAFNKLSGSSVSKSVQLFKNQIESPPQAVLPRPAGSGGPKLLRKSTLGGKSRRNQTPAFREDRKTGENSAPSISALLKQSSQSQSSVSIDSEEAFSPGLLKSGTTKQVQKSSQFNPTKPRKNSLSSDEESHSLSSEGSFVLKKKTKKSSSQMHLFLKKLETVKPDEKLYLAPDSHYTKRFSQFHPNSIASKQMHDASHGQSKKSSQTGLKSTSKLGEHASTESRHFQFDRNSQLSILSPFLDLGRSHATQEIKVQKSSRDLCSNAIDLSPRPYCDCKPRILIVDDTEFNILTVSTMIQQHFKVQADEAQNGQIAFDMFREGLEKPCKCPNRAYRLILMDIQMPIMDGYEATSKILQLVQKQKGYQSSLCLGFSPLTESQPRIENKQQVLMRKQSLLKRRLAQRKAEQVKETPDLECTIVALTAYTSDESIQKCLDLGMKQVLAKPVSIKQIKEVISLYYLGMTSEEYKAQQKEYRVSQSCYYKVSSGSGSLGNLMRNVDNQKSPA